MEQITVNLDDTKHKVKVIGPVSELFFCVIDVATILGYSNNEQGEFYKLLKDEQKKYFKELRLLTNNSSEKQLSLHHADEEDKYISEFGLVSLKEVSGIPINVLTEILLAIKNYTIEKLMKSLEIKNHEIEEVKECVVKAEQSEKKALRRSLRLRDKVVQERIRSKTQYVYISTSKSYANQNRYKVGGVECYENLKSRLCQYNGRSAVGDDWYYCKFLEVANFRSFEQRFWDVMHEFRDDADLASNKKVKEMINMYYPDLEKVFDLVAQHYDSEIDFLNESMGIFIDNLNIDSTSAFIPVPCIFEEEKICLKNETRKTIADKELKEELLKVIKNSGKKSLRRLEIFEPIEKKYLFKRRRAWQLLKSLKDDDIIKSMTIRY